VKKAKISEPDFEILMNILLERVTLVPFEDFGQEYDQAMQIMKTIDENDSPFLAVGIALGIKGIWTEDRHFLRQNLLNVYSTGNLVERI